MEIKIDVRALPGGRETAGLAHKGGVALILDPSVLSGDPAVWLRENLGPLIADLVDLALNLDGRAPDGLG